LEKLIFNEKDEFKKLVDKSALLIKIKNNGEPVVLHRDKLIDSEKISCYILGKYFSKELEFVDEPTATINEISRALNMDKKKVSARLSNLMDQEIVERSSRGKYKISFIMLENYLDEIINKIKTY